jgi:hypothetical protein
MLQAQMNNAETFPNICIWNLDKWIFSYRVSLKNRFRYKIDLLIIEYSHILCFCIWENKLCYEIYSLVSKIIQFIHLFNTIYTCSISIALVLVLLSFENMTNTNTILTVGIVFQYNESRIVHLWLEEGMGHGVQHASSGQYELSWST